MLREVSDIIYMALKSWRVYHFHDTSATAPARRLEIVEDDDYLRPDASNIGAYLRRIRNNHPAAYRKIVATIRTVMPFFDDFLLRTRQHGARKLIGIDWLQKGSDYPMQPYHLSDGSLRFICLATALLQPDLPATLVIDEPELGLHPFALSVLADLIKATAGKTQIIISTQSPSLLDHFSPDDVIVVERSEGSSSFKRLDSTALSVWLDEYSLGDMYEQNIVQAGPSYE